jgi:hypothetical protein
VRSSIVWGLDWQEMLTWEKAIISSRAKIAILLECLILFVFYYWHWKNFGELSG